jgi:DNA-binding IclR family transcriptional regulator
MNTNTKQPAYPVGSVENALRLLTMLRDRPSIRVADAAAELSVARSTAHRLLAMLNAYELVTQDPKTRAYGPGPLLTELGLASLRHDDVITALHPFLEELSEVVNETAHLVVLEGPNIRFVDSVESQHALRATARVGVAYPAYLTSAGKALLAELSDAELRRIYPRRKLPQLTPRSPATRDALLEELKQVRALGYATNFGESELGIHAVGVAQRTSSDRVAAAMAVSAPEQRLPKSRVPEVARIMQEISTRARPRLA